jgi:site-specific recombinase XerD
MSIEYRKETEKKIQEQIDELISDAPYYVKDFAKHMHGGKREISTQLGYLRNVILFLRHEHSILSEYKDSNFSDLPISVLDSLRIDDINEYRDYLKDVKKLSNATMRKHLVSISVFYKYLLMKELVVKDPTQFVEAPPVNKKKIVHLDSSLSNRLLNGILANDKYLIEPEDGDEYVVDILEPIRIKREPLVLRNYAIVCLFLGSGLRISELVGLDLEDVDFRNNQLTVVVKGGDETTVYFGEEVAKALKEYINGLPIPSDLADKYKYTNSEAYEWCKNHLADDNFIKNLEEKYPECDESFKRDMIKLRYSMLRQGRSSLKPQKGNKAVFITTRGTRMSVRSVELMIKEMVKTYLPDYEDKDKFSPHKLRATCATRILSQTGDIQMASTQLNHANISVTAEFYAAIQKDRQKNTIKNLDINEW